MKARDKRNTIRLVAVITGSLLLSLGTACTQKGDVDQEEPCGIGDGTFCVETEGTVDTSFNCNDVGVFTVTLQPVVTGDYVGFCRLWLELEKEWWIIHRSNYVEFYVGNSAPQELEWGGSLPTGLYEINAVMTNVQFSSSCADSVYWKYACRVGFTYITEFTNPQKVMEIEYFCQTSDTTAILRYDVFLSTNTDSFIDIAFNAADTRHNLYTYQTDLVPELILNTEQAIAEYIYAHKQFDDRIFLCGIKGFRNQQGNLLEEQLGRTVLPEEDTLDFQPSCYSGSLVAVKACMNFAAPEYEVDYDYLITGTTVHELCHQRGVWGHHVWGAGPRFCLMNPNPWYPSGHGTHPHWAETYSNPHFCQTCISKIKSITR